MLRSSTGHGKKSFSSSSNSSSSSSSFSSSSSSSSSCASLQIKEDDKFFSKLLSRENSSLLDRTNKPSSSASSKALYYGGSQGSVPFTWESRPGTPKNPTVLADTYPLTDAEPDRIPPLTPPPNSYFSSSSRSAISNVHGKSSLRRKQHNMSLSGIVSRVKSTGSNTRTRSHTQSLSSAASSSPWTWSGSGSSSVSHSSAPTISRLSVEQRRSRSRLQSGTLHDHVDNDKKTGRKHRSPDSTLKYGSRRKHPPPGNNNKFWVCPVAKVKRVILSIVGQRPSSSSHRRAAK